MSTRIRMYVPVGWFVVLLLVFSMTALLPAHAHTPAQTGPHEGEPGSAPSRLIVEFETPPLAAWLGEQTTAPQSKEEVSLEALAATTYLSRLENEQTLFAQALTQAVPAAQLSSYVDAQGTTHTAQYQVVFHGVSVEVTTNNLATTRNTLSQMPGVKAVYSERVYQPALYASTELINAPIAWQSSTIGGRANAGSGVKIASIDCGLHHEAPMFNGDGYFYPTGYPRNGLGLHANNNGKIVASRTYFRPSNPPLEDEENAWPGPYASSHGVHTGAIAAGGIISPTIYGGTLELPASSGVAPGAWLMSYRVCYPGLADTNGAFYTTELLAALEDAVADEADVIINSWGAGPISEGGAYDPVDAALVNASQSGVVVVMAAGNEGPGGNTIDHPSSDYITVAASTTSGYLRNRRLSISDPQPVPEELGDVIFQPARFGPPLPIEEAVSYPFVTARSIDPRNIDGCEPWEDAFFRDKAAVLRRGSCPFDEQVLNAQNAGATFVVIYNYEQDGYELVAMEDSGLGEEITISSIFISYAGGNALAEWYDEHANASKFVVNTQSYQAGNEADRIASFSSRGPGVGNVLKPDLAAPGVHIVSQGYDPYATGEERHFGYGQMSGTSMAAPHVAGAAAVVLQAHPDWTPAQVKSALMTTAQYVNIYNDNHTPAQPLDMGAGRLDLQQALDPGIILDPPMASFGEVPENEPKTVEIRITSVSDRTETYRLNTWDTSQGFTETVRLDGFTVSPASITLSPGQSSRIRVEFTPRTSKGMGDNQGYITLTSESHEAHMPAWARVVPQEYAGDVLILDNDGSTLDPAYSSKVLLDYTDFYSRTLDTLEYSYTSWDVDAQVDEEYTVPDPATLSSYRAVIYFTGDNDNPVLSEQDQNRLTEYANNGGTLIVMGQNAAASLQSDNNGSGTFLYNYTLASKWVQHSLTNGVLPTLSIIPTDEAPPAFENLLVDVSGTDQYEGYSALSKSGLQPTTPTGDIENDVTFRYNAPARELEYTIHLHTTELITLTHTQVYTSTVQPDSAPLYTLYQGPPQPLNAEYEGEGEGQDGVTLKGKTTISVADNEELLQGNFFLHIGTEQNPAGELRGRIQLFPVRDVASNQRFMDELEKPQDEDIPNGEITALLKYPGPYNMHDGVVAIARRSQPSLENPGIPYHGRSIYTSFGLEGVNNGNEQAIERHELLQLFLNWAWDAPQATIEETTTSANRANDTVTFVANLETEIEGNTGARYRWDFGDGQGYLGPFDSPYASYRYQDEGTYTVRVEITDALGNRAIGTLEDVSYRSRNRNIYDLFVPMIANQQLLPPAAPTDLTATSVLTDRVTLTWQDNSDDERNFGVRVDYPAQASEEFFVAANETTTTIENLQPGTEYCFTAFAYGDGGKSEPSNEACVTTDTDKEPPAAPTNLEATTVNNSSVALTWQDNSDNESGFGIVQADEELATVVANTTIYTAEGLLSGEEYCFSVYAYNDDGQSDATKPACATLP